MLVGFYWLDSWMRVMQALSAPQVPAIEAPRETAAAAALREDMATLRAALEETDRALATERGSRESLAAQLDAEERMGASARLLVQQLRRAYAARIAELQAVVDEQDERLAGAELRAFSAVGLGRQLHAAYAARVAELDDALDEVAGQVAAAAAETAERLEAEATARVEMQGQLDELNRTLAEANKQTATTRAENDRLAAKIGSLEEIAKGEVEKHAAERAELNRRLAEILERVNQAEAAQAEAEAQTRRLQDTLDDVTAERDDLARRLAEAEVRVGAPAAVAEEVENTAKKAKPRGRKSKPEAAPARVAPLPVAELVPPVAAEPTAPAAGEAVPAEGLLIGFRKPADWTAPLYVYIWETQPPVQTPAWPGVEMQADAYGWCVQRLAGVQAASLVFTDSAGHQTGNLRRESDGWLDTDGRWSDGRP